VTATATPPPRAPTRQHRPGRTAAWITLAALAAAGCWAVADLRINVATFIDSARNAADFAGRMLPLDFPPLGELLALSGQTMAIVVWATLLSVVISVPLAILAASNTTPGHAARYGARTLIVVVRAVPDVVLAIIFFRVFFSHLGDRHVFQPYGIFGGKSGSLAESILNPQGNGEQLHSKETREIKKGDILSFRLSGAGGYGPPEMRDPKAIAEDIADGFVTHEAAERDYGPHLLLKR